MVAAPLLLIRLRGNLGQDFYFLFGVWSVCICSKNFRPEEPLKRIASPQVEAVRDSIEGHRIYSWAPPYFTGCFARRYSTPGCRSRAVQQSFEEFGASGFSGGVKAELMCQRSRMMLAAAVTAFVVLCSSIRSSLN